CQRRITLSNAMSITPMSPAISQQGWVQTWVTSQWKNRPIPGQFSAEINSGGLAAESTSTLMKVVDGEGARRGFAVE
ncbi:MAG: hypothetical protein J0H84_25360, partial [Rhizobiales bacterium]|nr:hypothetical protein [Hyphomicrobiales bacterium]